MAEMDWRKMNIFKWSAKTLRDRMMPRGQSSFAITWIRKLESSTWIRWWRTEMRWSPIKPEEIWTNILNGEWLVIISWNSRECWKTSQSQKLMLTIWLTSWTRTKMVSSPSRTSSKQLLTSINTTQRSQFSNNRMSSSPFHRCMLVNT